MISRIIDRGFRACVWLAVWGSLCGVGCSDKTSGPSSTTGPRRSNGGDQAGIVARLKTPFSNIVVWDDGEYRCLAFGKRTAIQSCVNRGNKLDFRYEYVRMMLATVALTQNNAAPKRVLVLGLGGAALPTLVSKLYPGVHIDAVEIDRGVYQVAKRYLFYKPTSTTKVHVQDAFKFVTRGADAASPPQYDLIWVDCFDAKHIPAHLMSDRFVTGLRRLLKPSGVLAANLWSTHPSYPKSVKRYRRIFTEAWRIKGHHSSNHVLIGLRRTLGVKPADVLARANALDKRALAPFPLAVELKRLKKLP